MGLLALGFWFWAFAVGLWDFYTHAEIEGSLRIVDREKSKAEREWLDQNEEALIEEARKIQEKERLENE